MKHMTCAALLGVMYFLFHPTHASGQSKEVQQSSYYDAIELYYLLKKTSVYPEMIGLPGSSLSRPGSRPAVNTGISANPGINANSGISANSEGSANSGITANPGSNLNTDSIERPGNSSNTLTQPQAGQRPQRNPGLRTPVPAEQLPANNQGNAATSGDLGWFRLIECVTGKVIRDSVPGEEIADIHIDYPFTDDALRLQLIDTILSRYLSADKTMLSGHQSFVDQFDSAKSTNPNKHLYNYLITGIDDNSPNSAVTSPPSGKGGAGQFEKILQGVTDWTIEAVNREIQESFLVHLKEKLSKNAELRILFPKTLACLSTLTITNYNNSLNVLKTGYTEDLQNLCANFSKLADDPKYQRLLKSHPPFTLIFGAADIYDGVSKNLPIAQTLFRVNQASYLSADLPQSLYKTIFVLAGAMSNALRNVRAYDQNKEIAGWINKDQLGVLLHNDDLLKIFLSLLAERTADIQILPAESLKQTILSNIDGIVKTKGTLNNFFQSVEAIEISIQQLYDEEKSQTISEKSLLYIQAAKSILGLGRNVVDLLPTTAQLLPIRHGMIDTYEKSTVMLESMSRVVTHVHQKDYTGAVYEVDSLISHIVAFRNPPTPTLDTALTTQITNDWKDDKSDKVRRELLHYGIFIANMAEAETPEEVKTAINAVALPTGSSRIKKVNYFSWGINAYAGVYHSWNKQYEDISLKAREWGIFVPVGIAASWGKVCNGSLSVYGGIIDVGAIFTYRMNPDNGDVESDINLGQVLSPSLSVIYGLPVIKEKYNIPLSIGASFQWGPRLKQLKDGETNSVLPRLTNRFHLFLAFDLPVLNFHVAKNRNN